MRTFLTNQFLDFRKNQSTAKMHMYTKHTYVYKGSFNKGPLNSFAMGTGAKPSTSVLISIWFGTKHLNHFIGTPDKNDAYDICHAENNTNDI